MCPGIGEEISYHIILPGLLADNGPLEGSSTLPVEFGHVLGQLRLLHPNVAHAYGRFGRFHGRRPEGQGWAAE